MHDRRVDGRAVRGDGAGERVEVDRLYRREENADATRQTAKDIVNSKHD